MFTATLRALRVLKIEKVTDLSSGFALSNGNPFSLFIAPADGSSLDVGDVAIVNATIPYDNGNVVEVPVVVGDWSPVVFDSLDADNTAIADCDIYAAEIKIDR